MDFLPLRIMVLYNVEKDHISFHIYFFDRKFMKVKGIFNNPLVLKTILFSYYLNNKKEHLFYSPGREYKSVDANCKCC